MDTLGPLKQLKPKVLGWPTCNYFSSAWWTTVVFRISRNLSFPIIIKVSEFPLPRCMVTLPTLHRSFLGDIQGWFSFRIDWLDLQLGSLSFLQGIFQTQGLNLVFAGIFFTVWATREALWSIMKVKSLSHVQLFAIPWTVVYQASLSMGFSRQEYWSGLPFPSPGDLPDPGIEPRSPALQADTLPSKPPGKHSDSIFIYISKWSSW